MNELVYPARISSRQTLVAGLAAFSIYTCMYALRKPYTVSGFENLHVWGMDYKILLIIAQTIGYTLSKFIGIRFIGGLKRENRPYLILVLMGIAWTALFFFAIFPPPSNIVFLLFNGIPLGMIYGLVFSYLEGRASTELLGAMLASSFIFSSGLTQSAGKWLLTDCGINQWWMPWLTGLLFMPVLILSTWLLNRLPDPDRSDVEMRTARVPMSRADRNRFLKTFFPGLVLLISAYVLLTVIRDFRSNFAADIWKELGQGTSTMVYTWSEMPASVVVLVIMGLLVFVRRNDKALYLNHLLIMLGAVLTLAATFLYQFHQITAFVWFASTGIGLYLSYVPFNCMLFERLIASFRHAGNAGFIIYVADAFGYLGSDCVLVVKNFAAHLFSWTGFYIKLLVISAGLVAILVTASYIYFRRKYQRLQQANTNQ